MLCAEAGLPLHMCSVLVQLARCWAWTSWSVPAYVLCPLLRHWLKRIHTLKHHVHIYVHHSVLNNAGQSQEVKLQRDTVPGVLTLVLKSLCHARWTCLLFVCIQGNLQSTHPPSLHSVHAAKKTCSISSLFPCVVTHHMQLDGPVHDAAGRQP